MQHDFLETDASCINFRWRVKNTSLAIPWQNQEECFAPFDFKQTKTTINKKKTQKWSWAWSYMLICSFSWSIFDFSIFVMIFLISGSLIQSKSMFFNTLDILEHHRNDPWWNWEKSFFHENFEKLGRPTFWWRPEKFRNVMKFKFQSDHRFWKL